MKRIETMIFNNWTLVNKMNQKNWTQKLKLSIQHRLLIVLVKQVRMVVTLVLPSCQIALECRYQLFKIIQINLKRRSIKTSISLTKLIYQMMHRKKKWPFTAF